ncbi:hypothetical protein [Allokutzneria sp. NRRL B-24872]|uniref:hypothetical protein n=1 Tax=Allokutzneria sp. NRRL B-24872 TaxID=1137961 RepID=UPI00143CFD4A|nr:hypothetical protein [Allokutzneria sp. NRRL B-24872]
MRDEIDDLLRHHRSLQAIIAFRERSSIRPKPGIALASAVIAHRQRVLSEEGRTTPAP